MMDVPSAAFVIRSFARHSVGHSGMAYNERGAGIRRRRSLSVVLFPFTNHDAASVASPLKCAFGGTRQFSWLLAALNAAIAASALAFIAVCGSIDFWPEQIDILTEARARTRTLFPPRDPRPHSTTPPPARPRPNRPSAISLPVDCRVAASFLTLVLSPFDVDPPCQMQTLFPLLHLRSNESRAAGDPPTPSIFRGYFRPEL